MRRRIEEYIRRQGWTFAGVSQPDHRRQWAKVVDGKVVETASEEELVAFAEEALEARKD